MFMAENTRVDRALQAVLVILVDRVHRNELKGLGEPSRVCRQETRLLIVGWVENGTGGVGGTPRGGARCNGRAGRGARVARWLSWSPVYIRILKN